MRRIPRALLCALATTALVGTACEQISPQPDIPEPQDASAAFFEAWASEDFQAMYRLTTPGSRVPGSRLQRSHESLVGGGALASYEVAPDEAGPEQDEGSAVVPYTVTLESEAAAAPVTLTGELEMTYDDEAGEWLVEWDRSAFLPGLAGATGLRTQTRYPKRAPILDRNGRRLAVGHGVHRRYPWGTLAGTTIGHIAPAPAGSKILTPLSERGRLVGASGIELAYEERLAGTPSAKLLAVGRKRKVVEVLGRVRGETAKPLRTTLDVDIQRAAASAYGGTTGGTVVLDPKTGDILAAVSSSEFNPNSYVGVDIEPFNRALFGQYPPGSSMKVMTAAAALEEGIVTPSTTVQGPSEYQGVRNFESGNYPSLSFATAVQKSVNTAFARIALKLGSDRLTGYAEAFGFNKDPEMPLGAATPSFPKPTDAGDLMWGSIGQAQTLATPLQMATVAATVANGGKRMEPRISLDEPPTGVRAVSRKTAATLTDLMQAVVTGGTGTAANVGGFGVAGKTGTAEVDVAGERKNHAWFICFAPGDDPKVAVSVVSEYGGIGGQVAAPIAGRILLNVMPHV